jgi:hypothetical protein
VQVFDRGQYDRLTFGHRTLLTAPGSSGGLTGQGQSAAHRSIAQSATPC